MPIAAAAIMAGGQLIGGMMAGDAASSAAAQSAAAQLESARIAAEAQKFRPVGVTSRFGKSAFTMDDKGYLTGASYELTPELKALQDRVMALTGSRLSEAELADQRYAGFIPASEQLFGLGSQYLSESPEAVAARYMQKQQDLLAPSRERQYAQLQNQLYQTGRGGLSVGATGMRPGGGMGLRAANPEMEAYYNALAQQDAALAAQAEEAGQRQVAFGTGLYNTGANLLGLREAGLASSLNPFTTTLGGASTLESLGQQPLDIGAQLGGRAATAGANVGQSLLTGGISAAKTAQVGNSYSPFGTALQGLSSNPTLATGLSQWIQSSNQPAYNTPYRGSYNEDSSSASTPNTYFTPNAQRFGY
jgi:hypothetical protein